MIIPFHIRSTLSFIRCISLLDFRLIDIQVFKKHKKMPEEIKGVRTNDKRTCPPLLAKKGGLNNACCAALKYSIN